MAEMVSILESMNHTKNTMKNLEQIKDTRGSYESTITFVERGGYGCPEYRVKVTYNSGDHAFFIKSFDTLAGAKRASRRELNKLTA